MTRWVGVLGYTQHLGTLAVLFICQQGGCLYCTGNFSIRRSMSECRVYRENVIFTAMDSMALLL